MKIRLWPDRHIRVEKTRAGKVPVLILRPANSREAIERFRGHFEYAMEHYAEVKQP